MRGNNFRYLVKQGIVSVWHNRMMSFASFCIMMVSLILVGMSVLIFMNINIIVGNVEDKNEVMVFLTEGVTETDIAHIRDVIVNVSNVSEAAFYSKEKALDEFLKAQGEYSVLFEKLPRNPMPDSFRVKINDLSIIGTTVERLSAIEKVETVSAPYDFAGFLVGLRTTLGILGSALFFALTVVSLVIISNAARTSVFTRRKEINIMKYVGATNSFIRIPFFVEGMFIGILAGVSSWLITGFAYNALFKLFSGDAGLFSMLGTSELIAWDNITWWVLLLGCTAGAILGAVGTVFSMGKHLKV